MKIKVAIIGAGRMGQRHAEAYKKIKNVEIIGFYDKLGKNANDLAKKFKVKKLTLQQILKDKTIEAVNVCTPNFDHAKMTISALNSGKHVLVEKPMATNLKDCNEMINAAKKNKVNLMVGQTYRFYPSSIITKKIIDKKNIGKIKIIQIQSLDPGFISGQKKMPTWYNKKESGGGVIFDLIHVVDLLRYWLNSEILEVSVPLIEKIDKKASAEQMTLVVLKFKNGTAVSLMAVAPSWGIRDTGIKIVGEKGLLYTRYGEEVKVGNKKWKQYDFPFKSRNTNYKHNLAGFINELQEFIDSINEKRKPSVSGNDGKANVLGILSIYQAAKKSKSRQVKIKR